jgi:hypothetical protein
MYVELPAFLGLCQPDVEIFSTTTKRTKRIDAGYPGTSFAEYKLAAEARCAHLLFY